jgi:hypothetical protein
MTVIRKIKISPVAEWWIAIRPIVNSFAEVIQQSPMLRFEDADEIASQLKELYNAVQQVYCPDEANEAYTHLTRAMLNLFMCYEALGLFQWDKGDTFYGRATTDWIYAKGSLYREGILKIAI